MRASVRCLSVALPFALACASNTKTIPANAGEVDVGYGTMDRQDATGAVSSIDREDLGGAYYTRVEEMIAGRVAGVDVRANANGSYTITIRGINSINSGVEPLVVVDGVPAFDVAVLGSINPRDVRRIDVLRDAASTSIYGSRGANGVILIATRDGRD